MHLLLHPHQHQVPLLLLLQGKLHGLFISAAVTACFTVCLCMSPYFVRAPQDEDIIVCVYQEQSKRSIHTRTRTTPRGESTKELPVAKSMSYGVRVWRAIRQSSPVLNHDTDNTHGAYPADPSDGFPFTTVEKLNRVDRTAQFEGQGTQHGAFNIGQRSHSQYIRNPKSRLFAEARNSTSSQRRNCE